MIQWSCFWDLVSLIASTLPKDIIEDKNKSRVNSSTSYWAKFWTYFPRGNMGQGGGRGFFCFKGGPFFLKASFLGEIWFFLGSNMEQRGEGGLYEGGRVCPLNHRSTRSSRSVGRFMVTHCGPCSHIVLCSKMQGVDKKRMEWRLGFFCHLCLKSKIRVTNKYGEQHRSTHTPICAR